MDGLGYDYSGGIFGGGGIGADDGTSALATPAAAEPAVQGLTADQARAIIKQMLMTTPPDMAPAVDQLQFDVSSGTRRPRPSSTAGVTTHGLMTVGMLVQGPAGVHGRMYAFVPAALVAALPENERKAWSPMAVIASMETQAGNSLILPWYEVMGGAGYGFAISPSDPQFKDHVGPNGVYFVMADAAAPMVVPPPAKAGMGLGTMALLGIGVFAAGYAVTRVAQKKPIFPKMK